MYEQIAALEYPNGRTHRCTVTSPRLPAAGAEFDMFARTWRVSHVHYPRRGSDSTYLVCIAVGRPAPLAAAAS
jgi:hypothetical protein